MVRGNALDRFESCLTARYWKLKVGNCLSFRVHLPFAVPQVSVLVPLLFTLSLSLSLSLSVSAITDSVFGEPFDSQRSRSVARLQMLRPFIPSKLSRKAFLWHVSRGFYHSGIGLKFLFSDGVIKKLLALCHWTFSTVHAPFEPWSKTSFDPGDSVAVLNCLQSWLASVQSWM